MGTSAIWALLLLGLGLMFLMAEIFLPSGGILAITTFVLLVMALLSAWAAWGQSNPMAWWAFLAATLFLVPTTMAFAFQLLPRTRFGKRILLEAPTSEEVTPYAAETAHLESLRGQIGVTASLLNPGGLVTIAGERLHAVSEGLMLDAGTPVEIVAVRGTRVVVRPTTSPSPRSDQPGEGAKKDHSLDPLDFEIPNS